MNLLKNFKKDDILMLVVAFLLGYFAHRILKGCQIVEGITKGCIVTDAAGPSNQTYCSKLRTEKACNSYGELVAGAGGDICLWH